MTDVSENIFALEPVTFTYKEDQSKTEMYGLIAEEVDKVFPRLVIYNSDKQPETVRYHELPILLLNELKKLRARVDELEKKCSCRQDSL